MSIYIYIYIYRAIHGSLSEKRRASPGPARLRHIINTYICI